MELTRSPWSMGALQLPHRVILGSMHTGLEVTSGSELAAFYRERVEGGAGLIITGGLAINSTGRGGADYAVLGQPETAARFVEVADAVHQAGGLISAQLFHAGRYALLEGLTDGEGRPEQAVAPSPIPWRAARGAVPRELTEAEIEATIDDYARAAKAAAAIGFDAVEIMASEGYLINQFCSPLTNLRSDSWGGDLSRRYRFAVEVIRAVHGALPQNMPVAVRISGDDLMPGSSTPDEVDELVRVLLAAGIDGISVGMGWHESRVPTVQSAVPHGAWLAYAERIAGVVRASKRPEVPVIASNRMTDLRDVELVLRRGLIDAVALARPFLADPAIIQTSFAGEFDRVNTCIGCNQACIDRSLIGAKVSCLVNPRAGNELRHPLALSDFKKTIAVVGGGPAGLAAAVDLARRGHQVRLFEAADRLGGQFLLAAVVPGKEDYLGPVRAAEVELRSLGAEIITNTRAGLADLQSVDGVIVATGVRPRRVELPGADLPHVMGYEQALSAGVPPGRVVIIGGGGIGLDVAGFLVEPAAETIRAEEFAARYQVLAAPALVGSLPQRAFPPTPAAPSPRPGEQVTILRRSGRFGEGVGITSRWVAIGRLRDAGVQMINGVQYRSITSSTVEITDAGGTDISLPADVVVVCAGQVSNGDLVRELADAQIRHQVVGGALNAAGVDGVRATAEGLAAARSIAP